MDDIKNFTKNEKDLEILMQTVRIYRDGISYNNEKQKMTYDGRNRTTKLEKKSERPEKWKPANTSVYWKQAALNMKEMMKEKNQNCNTLGERVNYWKPN